jgi:hypothetical protein
VTASSLKLTFFLPLAFCLGLWAGPHLLTTPVQSPTASIKDKSTKSETAVKIKAPGEPNLSQNNSSLESTPAEILLQVLENPDRHARERELETLGSSHFRHQSDWEKRLTEITDQVDRTSYLKGIILEWSKSDPLSALNYLTYASLGTRIQLVPIAVSEWAKRDPKTAEKWVTSSSFGEVRTQATESLYRAWALLSPEAAAQNSLSFSDVSLRERALSGVLQEWSANDLPAVAAFTATIKEGSLHSVALRAVAEEMARRNPLEAIRWANAELSTSNSNTGAIVSTVASIAGMEQPSAILEWLVNLPQTADTASAIAGVSSYRAEADPSFAEQGYLKLPAHAQEIAAASIAGTLGATNPLRGQEWLRQQSTPMQSVLTEEFTRGWASTHQEAAQRWVQTLAPGPNRAAAERGLKNSLPID